MVERRAEAERAAAANARERQSLAEQLQLEVWARQEAEERASEAERRAADAGAVRGVAQDCQGARMRQHELAAGHEEQLRQVTDCGEPGTPLLPLKASVREAPLPPPTLPVVSA